MNSSPSAWSPYCGSAPLPGDILLRWNLDPILLVALAAALTGGALLLRPGRQEELAWYSGMAALVIAFVSPLCALSSGLFSARSLHHLLVVALAAPLLGYALADFSRRLPLGVLAAVHFLTFWAWHAPSLYAAALSNDLTYWLMQGALVGTGVLFWGALYSARNLATQVGALLAAVIQMGLLGAIITFAPQAMYAPHYATAALYGLSALDDQQLAGVIMWVASLPLILGAGIPLIRRYPLDTRVAA